MKPVPAHAELSLQAADALHLVYDDAELYTPEPDFHPEFATPARPRPPRAVRSLDLPAPPRTRDEAIASLHRALSELGTNMRSAAAMSAREIPATLPIGIAALDASIGGLPLGALTEVHGAASSGRTSLLMSALASATSRGQTCALVDAADNFSPHSAHAAGVALSHLLWVRCNGAHAAPENNAPRFAENDFGGHDLLPRHESAPSAARLARAESFRRLEQALKITDLLIQAGGFGLIALDTAGLPADVARRIPLTTWFRFRRAIEHTPTVLLAVGQESTSQSCASLVLRLERLRAEHGHVDATAPTFTSLLESLEIGVGVERAPSSDSAGKKKLPRSATVRFTSEAAWR